MFRIIHFLLCGSRPIKAGIQYYLEGVDFEPLLYSFILSCTIERPRGGCCLLIQIHCETIFVIQCEHIKTFYSQS